MAREHAIAVSCRMKAAIVGRDERETGERALLNLGHTFGHALEAGAGFSERLLHGEAIALGMVLAFGFSARRGLLSAADAARVESHLAAVGLPVDLASVPGGVPDADRLMELICPGQEGQARKVDVHSGSRNRSKLRCAGDRCVRGSRLSGRKARRAMNTRRLAVTHRHCALSRAVVLSSPAARPRSPPSPGRACCGWRRAEIAVPPWSIAWWRHASADRRDPHRQQHRQHCGLLAGDRPAAQLVRRCRGPLCDDDHDRRGRRLHRGAAEDCRDQRAGPGCLAGGAADLIVGAVVRADAGGDRGSWCARCCGCSDSVSASTRRFVRVRGTARSGRPAAP